MHADLKMAQAAFTSLRMEPKSVSKTSLMLFSKTQSLSAVAEDKYLSCLYACMRTVCC